MILAAHRCPEYHSPVAATRIAGGDEPLAFAAKLIQLLEEGRTREVLSGFRSRAGKPFRARLVLTPEGKVEFDFPARPSRDGEGAEAESQEAEPAAAEGRGNSNSADHHYSRASRVLRVAAAPTPPR